MAKGQVAWLLEWSWAGEHAAVEDRIAAILSPRLGDGRVKEIVELLYAIRSYTASELALFAKRPEQVPYKATWERGICSCGHNPYITARKVRNLVVKEDLESDAEVITFVYPEYSEFSFESGKKEFRREARLGQISRPAVPLSNRPKQKPSA